LIYAANEQRRRDEIFSAVMEYLASHPCVDCGEPDIIVLEFDHVRGEKTGNVSQLMISHSLAKVMQEIAKCEVRCANCHRRQTFLRGGFKRAVFAGETLTSEARPGTSVEDGAIPSAGTKRGGLLRRPGSHDPR
jgi:hypothetical protein